MSGQCIAVVSGKGGTGKTSLTAGVGTALAQSGKRVLCVDCDIGLRNLDLALGLTDRALMDFSDVALDRCPLEAAVVAHPSIPNLYLLTAPVRMRGPAVTEEDFRRMLRKIRQQFDFCLLDAPAGLGRGFQLATCAADRCVVVTTADASSLRDAQRTVTELGHLEQVHLVMNRIQPKLLRKLRRAVESIETELAKTERRIADYDARFAAATAYDEADYKAYDDLKAHYDHLIHEWEKASYELEITENG